MERVFENARAAYQILLAISVSVVINERSLIKLELILTFLRPTLGREQLNDLAFMCKEHEDLEVMYLDEMINSYENSA